MQRIRENTYALFGEICDYKCGVLATHEWRFRECNVVIEARADIDNTAAEDVAAALMEGAHLQLY